MIVLYLHFCPHNYVYIWRFKTIQYFIVFLASVYNVLFPGMQCQLVSHIEIAGFNNIQHDQSALTLAHAHAHLACTCERVCVWFCTRTNIRAHPKSTSAVELIRFIFTPSSANRTHTHIHTYANSTRTHAHTLYLSLTISRSQKGAHDQ